MAHAYPTYEEQSRTPEAHEALATYATPLYGAPLLRVDRESRLRYRFEKHYNNWIAAPHLLLGYPHSHKWHTYKDYRAIIEMGWDAVPFILAQIREHNYMLMHLLPELTHKNVMISEDASEEETAKAWMQKLN